MIKIKKLFSNNKINLFNALFCFLLFIFPIPKTIALRYVTMFVLVLLMFTIKKQIWYLFKSPPSKIILILSAWLLVQISWSPYPLQVIFELKSQWINCLILFYIAYFFVSINLKENLFLNVIVIGLSSSVIFIFADYLLQIVTNGFPTWINGHPVFSNGTALTSRVLSSKVQIAFASTLLFTLLLSEILARHIFKYKTIFLSSKIVFFLMTISLVLNFLAGARNGLIGSALTLISSAFIVIMFLKNTNIVKKIGTLIFICFLISSMAFMAYKTDPRWSSVIDSAKLGMQFKKYQAWNDQANIPYPTLANNKVLEESAFDRAAFISAGLFFSIESPMGLGYSRKAFSFKAYENLGGRPRHAHSGVVEFLIGMGYPGFFLWLLFIASIVLKAIKRGREKFDVIALWGMLLPLGFMGRMVIENLARDHMLMSFMLSMGALSSALFYDENKLIKKEVSIGISYINDSA